MADVAVQPIAESPQVPDPVRWSLPQKLAFRFFCVYWLLYALPESGRVSIFGLLGTIPKAGPWMIGQYGKMWHAFVPWVATRFFHVTGQPATYFRTGSGDTTLQYINNLLYLLIALAAMAVWSVLDRKRPNYRTLGAWLRLVVRYTLALTLFSYGFAKVFPLQFQPPRNAKLMEPYGEFSPMGVLWSFMGASLPYTIYSGAAEVLGGLLMLFRRTTTLGAMIAATVMLNVAALNYCYDTPVKLYSTNLFLMAVFLFAWDARRLANVLVLNRPAGPSELSQVTFDRRWLRFASVCFWVLFVGYVLYGQIHSGWRNYKSAYREVKRPPLYGLYDVESGAPWHKLAVDFEQSMTVRAPDDKVQFLPTEYAGDAVTLNKKDKLAISRPDPEHVVLTGTLNGAPSTIHLKKIDTSKMLLLNRGFHWINEFPMNR
jgi:uncharacterized membrane protein YphA (DoxX/SURF4 family)